MRLLLLFVPLLAFGGQSIQISSAQVYKDSVDGRNPRSSCRVEWSMHNWAASPPPNAHPVDVGACGFDVQFLPLSPTDLRLQIYQKNSQGENSGVCQIPLSKLEFPFVTIRYQHIPNAGSTETGLDSCEAWDIVGQRFFAASKIYSNIVGETGEGVILSGAGGLSFAYFRLFSTTVPMGSRPPVTADEGDLLEWKFDGNLRDSSARSKNASVSKGSHSFEATPGQDLVVASIRTANAPPWSSWIPLRAGYPNQMDCSGSYSQADISAQVQCSWSVTGPSSAVFSNTTDILPTITGLTFGTYTFQLTVTDATGASTTKTLDVGAVPYDKDGVVIPPNETVAQLFGPMIALGQNPWGYADERAKRMVELQNGYFKRLGLDKPVWTVPGEGTVSYIYAGIGPSPSLPGTTLTQPVTQQEAVLEIADASRLPGLRALPTWILVGNQWGGQEVVRVCSTTALSGPAALGVCYDGRGLSGASINDTQTISKAWPAGTIVGEYKVQGTGTRFISDAQRPICPGGAPGPAGAVIYSEGLVELSPGSNRIRGDGTTWTTANGVIKGRYIRVEGTHDGTPFVYWSRISSVDDQATLTVDRPLPADIDPANAVTYKIIGYRFVSLEFTAPDGAVQNGLQITQGCESEDVLFAVTAHDFPNVNQQTMSGLRYSFKDSLGIQSAFGPNFYGSGLAARSVYFRSGWNLAKETADMMDEYWIRDPEIAGGWRGGIPLLQGGAVIGAIADLVTNPDTQLQWSDIRPFAQRGVYAAQWGCNSSDSRDSGYMGAWLILAANLDPDPQQHEVWQSALQKLLERETKCQQEDHSWAHGFVFNTASPALTLTPGSDLVTGSGFTPGLCFGVAQGTVEVTQGSAAIRGSGLVNGAKIALSGTRNNVPFTGFYRFVQTDGTSGTLAALWPGDSGTVSFVIENNSFLTTIATDNNDPQLAKNWACTYISSQQLQLNRPWDGPSTNRGHIYSYEIAGFGQQPYMLGMKIAAMRWATNNTDLSLAIPFQELSQAAATWLHDVGYDPVTQGLHYARLFSACEPDAAPPPAPLFDYRTPGCSFGLAPGGIRAARTLSAEASVALGAYLSGHPTEEARDWADRVYGSIWGYCPYTKPGFYCDPYYVRDENSDAALSGHKWSGFFFGMGMAHQWPAIRQSAVSPLRRR